MLTLTTCECPECSALLITPGGKSELCEDCDREGCAADGGSPWLHQFDYVSANGDWHLTL